MGRGQFEQGLLRGANSKQYRHAVASAGMPDTRPHEHWRDSLITRVGYGSSCWGNAWKPGAKAYPGQLKLEVFSDGALAYLLFLESPVDACEIAGAPQPAFALIGEGFAQPSCFTPSGYRQVNVFDELSAPDFILAGLFRGVRDSAFATKLGALAPEEIRRIAQEKIVMQARTAPMGDIKF